MRHTAVVIWFPQIVVIVPHGNLADLRLNER